MESQPHDKSREKTVPFWQSKPIIEEKVDLIILDVTQDAIGRVKLTCSAEALSLGYTDYPGAAKPPKW